MFPIICRSPDRSEENLSNKEFVSIPHQADKGKIQVNFSDKKNGCQWDQNGQNEKSNFNFTLVKKTSLTPDFSSGRNYQIMQNYII